MMNRESALQVEALDREITDLQKTLQELNKENAPRDLTQIDQPTLLENEIQQKRKLLHDLLRGQPRPWFVHRLPSEILEQIFQWITDPSDQLKLLQTFPRLDPLMHWDEGTLYFKLVYPLIARSLWEDWRDIWRLCQVCPNFMDVVLDHWKSEQSRTMHRDHIHLRKYDYHNNGPHYKFSGFIAACNELGRTAWMTNIPFLGTICFWSTLDRENEDGDDESELVKEFLTFLDTQGSRVWSCNIFLTCSGYSETEVHKVIHDILGRMPCLVSLELRQQNDDDTLDLNVDRRVSYPWPNLPHLRWLQVYNTDSFRLSLIGCYGPQLYALLTGDPPVPDNPELRLSRLVEYYAPWPWSPNTLPTCLLTSPLKILRLWNIEPEPGRTREVLMSMSHFGNTLQKLELCHKKPPREWREPLDMDAEFMTGIWLPKLRYLNINGKIRALDGLMHLPALRELEIYRDQDEASPGMIYLTKFDWDYLTTNIFQRLPNLEQIHMTWVDGRCYEGNLYTRAKHEAHERSLAQDETNPRDLP